MFRRKALLPFTCPPSRNLAAARGADADTVRHGMARRAGRREGEGRGSTGARRHC